MQTVAIIGLGLIGGSFALALRRAGFAGTILGVSSEAACRAALDRGIIDEAALLEQAAERADLLYLAQPILRIIHTLESLAGLVRPHALVTDAGSTKRLIVEKAESALGPGRFLGGHPMAGKEVSGVEASEATLFDGRTYVLTPARETDMETPQVREFLNYVRAIGARPVITSAEEHDNTVALTSHLPQLLSTALAGCLARKLKDEDFALAGPGLAGMVRLAQSPYGIWRDIIATNAEAITGALDAYLTALNELRGQIAADSLEGEFAKAAGMIRRWRSGSASTITGS